MVESGKMLKNGHENKIEKFVFDSVVLKNKYVEQI